MSIAFDRGNTLYNLKRYEQALREFTEALAEEPNSAPAHAMLSLCQKNLRRYREARAAAETAIAANPHYARGYYALAAAFHSDTAFTCRRRGEIPHGTWVREEPRRRLPLAMRAIDEALRIAPWDVNFLVLKSMIAFEDLNPRESLRAANDGLAINPQSAACHRMRAMVLRLFGDMAGAQTATDTALAAEPQSAVSHFNAGWTALYAGKHQTARDHFVEALRLNPALPNARPALLHALRGRFAIYQPILWIRLKLGTIKHRVAVYTVIRFLCSLIGLCVMLTLMPTITQETGETKHDIGRLGYSVITLGGIIVLAFCLIPCLTDYRLLYDPLGRLVLTRGQRLRAIVSCAFLLGMTALLGLLIVVDNQKWLNAEWFIASLFPLSFLLFFIPAFIQNRRSLLRQDV